ncbi:MAG TPA: CerR family C-terminal domain-containing protein [Phycisphaerales bacterium]|nr:CerR family C-terminal domain-containing protein [Phycisphaerales bacterium]
MTATPANTKAAIIQAAGELFASHGFGSVTARQVAKAADVALSAIPYHFGSMANLYQKTLLQACEISPQAVPLAKRAFEAPPEQGIRLAIEWAMEDYAGMQVAWPMRLITREELDPSPIFPEVIERKFAPEWNWLSQIVGRASGREPASPAVKFGVVTLYTLALSTLVHRAVLAKLAPDVLQTERAALIETIARLTLDAVERYATATSSSSSSVSDRA